MSVCKKKWLGFSVAVLLSGASFALPVMERTKLPTSIMLQWFGTDEEKALMSEALALEVYKDSEDKNQFYYIPPFRVRQYGQGATSPFLHVRQLEYYGEIQALLAEKKSAGVAYIAKLEMAVETAKNEVAEAKLDVDKKEEELAKAIAGENARLIALWEKIVAKAEKSLEDAQANQQEAEQALAAGKLDVENGKSVDPIIDSTIISFLNRAGFTVDCSGALSSPQNQKLIAEAVKKLESAYGGYLSLSVYAGFTQAQLTSLQAYLREYYPWIKVSLMPMDKINVGSLTELTSNDPNSGTQIYRKIQGAGDYLGVTAVMDLTIAGSFSAALHLGPHILPIKIEGELRHKPPATEAYLNCDFSSGWGVYGRTDVVDGFIFFDHDISTTLTAVDSGRAACDLKIYSGDQNSAELLALTNLKNYLVNTGIREIKLSKEQKESYFRGVMADIANNKRPAGSFADYYEAWKKDGLSGVIAKAASQAANSYWHTSKQNVANLSSLTFSQRIFYNGHEKITKDFATDVCLVWNPVYNAYDRCSPEELDRAKTMGKATQEASDAPECKGLKPQECGDMRDKLGKNPPDPNRKPSKDDVLPANI